MLSKITQLIIYRFLLRLFDLTVNQQHGLLPLAFPLLHPVDFCVCASTKHEVTVQYSSEHSTLSVLKVQEMFRYATLGQNTIRCIVATFMITSAFVRSIESSDTFEGGQHASKNTRKINCTVSLSLSDAADIKVSVKAEMCAVMA